MDFTLQTAGLMAAPRDGELRPSLGVGRAEGGGGGSGGPRAAGTDGAETGRSSGDQHGVPPHQDLVGDQVEAGEQKQRVSLGNRSSREF